MKILFLAMAFIATLNLSAQNSEEDKKNLIHIKEDLWPKAYQTQDITLLNQILADDFQMIDASGNVFIKKDEVSYIKQNKPAYDSYKYHVERLDIYDDKSAIVCGTGMIQGADSDGNYITTYRSSNVFIKRNGAWQAISSHVSGLNKTHMAKMERSGNSK